MFFALIVITVYFIKVNNSPKDFNDLYQFKIDEIIGGTISYMGDTDYEFTSEEMKDFVSLLKNSEYYRDGKVSNVIEGYLYYIQLNLKGDKFIDIVLSDQECLIKSDVKYKIISTKNINEYITNMLQEN
ncbi:hypothetical protein [Tissierella sp.]|uniref:hypothetical protein n=1 Tax=Tissierella sp. TaxID=41274 RepID=UPI003F96046D